MKVIITHDVDHITAWEHKKNLIIPKFIARSVIEFYTGYITPSELKQRFSSLIYNRWHNIEALMKFDSENHIPSTFFVAVNQGHKLCYSLENAGLWIKRILREGFDVGLHGIAFKNVKELKREHEVFQKISKLPDFGIRTHYLRMETGSLKNMEGCGYLFDSSQFELKNPYKMGKIWEFPLHIMDWQIIEGLYGRQKNLHKTIIKLTEEKIDKAISRRIKYLTVLFHDRYFNDSFYTWKNWYKWLIDYFKQGRTPFISYRDAIEELENRG